MSTSMNWTGSSTSAMREPLNESGQPDAKNQRVHAMAKYWCERRNTEKTNAVLGDQDSPASF